MRFSAAHTVDSVCNLDTVLARSTRRAGATLGGWAASLLILPALVLAQQVAIIEHPLPTAGAGINPVGIALGADNALWFTESAYDGTTNKIGRITTAGVITEYLVPTPGSTVAFITAGPDGALWFTEQYGFKIGRCTTAGIITEYPVPTPRSGSGPWGITAGADGALWFTEPGRNRIGRITTAGVVTEYPLPTVDAFPLGITAGSDGALWFVETTSNQIGRITTAGIVAEYPVPTANSGAKMITAGPDGALWFTEVSGGKVGRITTEGVITEYAVPVQDAGPEGITAGSDGALWFTTGYNGHEIGRITTSGATTEYPVPPGDGSDTGFGIAAGPNGDVWFTGGDRNYRVGQVVFPTAGLKVTPGNAFPGTTVTLAGSGFSAGESIDIYANSIGSDLRYTATANADGSFVVSGPVGHEIYGPDTAVALGQSSGKLGVAEIDVGARLRLDPRTGAEGNPITAEGFGFGADETIKVFWNTTRVLLGTTTTDSHGAFSQSAAFTFLIPAGAKSGANGVFAVGQNTGAVGTSHITVE